MCDNTLLCFVRRDPHLPFTLTVYIPGQYSVSAHSLFTSKTPFKYAECLSYLQNMPIGGPRWWKILSLTKTRARKIQLKSQNRIPPRLSFSFLIIFLIVSYISQFNILPMLIRSGLILHEISFSRCISLSLRR